MPEPSASRSGRALSAVFVVILLLCHGAFGVEHLISDPLSTPAAPVDHSAAHASAHHETHHDGQASSDGEERAAHHGAAEYFFVLLGIFLGPAFWLLRGSFKSWFGTATRLFGTRLPEPVVNLPRGPTPRLLQVFRL